MNYRKFKIACSLLCSILFAGISHAQPGGCVLKDTLFKIDFGNAGSKQEFNLRSLRAYERDFSSCPPDGYYAYASQTSECFNGDWITLLEDHTPNDINGKMFFVNANPRAAEFFVATLSGFKPDTKYEFSVWMMNLCKIRGGCSPLPPNIQISLITQSGKKAGSFKTGQIASTLSTNWKRYFAYFTTPPNETILTLRMEDMTNGGCGNDFTMDDITFRECYPPEPPVEVKEVKPQPVPAPKPVAVSKPEEKKPEVLKKTEVQVDKMQTENVVKSEKKLSAPVKVNIPDVLVSRENPVIKTIRTEPTTMLIELYDNGQIDGDTVTIYHNNELVVSHAGLSENPISFKIAVNKDQPHHEIIMVADNLGSIPPNTSLMVIKANQKRYEVFISSSEQKNAKLVIDLSP
ncbi:MAG: hypothetical protein JST02_04565 [Bacteroidetes bacterium]|nr:hypothetical protein [Bacteroidota bacterium]